MTKSERFYIDNTPSVLVYGRAVPNTKLNIKHNKNLIELDIKKIIETVDELKDESDKQNYAWEKFFKVIAPDAYAPIITENRLSGFLTAVRLFNDELAEDLEYYVYEGPGEVTKDGKKYTAKEYLLFNYSK